MTRTREERIRKALKNVGRDWVTARTLGDLASLFEGEVHWQMWPYVYRDKTVEKRHIGRLIRYRVVGKIE